ncbi:MAG TPA: HIT family protein [Candidatus Paceibacterota bacterium]
MKKNGCIFCQIAAGESPAHLIWEDEAHLAFLTIFPNTEGFSVIIPKEHHSSYFAQVPEEVTLGLVRAARTVAKKIDAAFPDVGRTALIFEGFGVDHLHAKLVPLHGTTEDEWKQRLSKITTYFDTYPGYVSSHDGERVSDEILAKIAQKIRVV